MWKVFDCGMAVCAAQNSVRARRMFFRADGNVFPLLRFHARLAMTGETGFILLEGLDGFFLAFGYRGEVSR